MYKKFSILTTVLFIIALLFLFIPNQTVEAKTITLTFAHPYSDLHPQHKGVLVPWAEKIEKDSNGEIKIKFITGGALGKPGKAYDTVQKGITDIGWDICDYSPGKFPLTTVAELPFMTKDGTSGSVALWKTYEKYKAFQDEYKDTKLLALAAHFPASFATLKKPIKSLEDFKGMKIKTATYFMTDTIKLLGAVPITQPVTETYLSLERGVIDGMAGSYDGIAVFKLHELLKYYTSVEIYNTIFWIAMNKKKYNKLTPAGKKAIDKNSGLILSKLHGKSFDDCLPKWKAICLKGGMKELRLPKSEMKKLIQLTKPLNKKWIKDMEKKGLPGKAVYKTMSALAK